MHITVEIKSVYGNDIVYPACTKSLLLAQLTGNKTLTQSALNTIEKLGYTINKERI